MKNIDLKRLNDAISTFSDERDWDQFHSIKNLTMALSVESAELLEIFQWLGEADSNRVKDDPKLKERVEEEVADIFIYLLRIVSKSHIDIEKSVYRKIQKNAEKYPVAKSRGSAKKYDEI